MNDVREKLILEIAGLSALLSNFPEPFQSHVIDLVGDLTLDVEVFDAMSQRHESQPDAIRSAGTKVRQQELGDFSKTSSLLHQLLDLLEPLADREPEKLDHVLDIACAEFVHRRIWSKLIDENPQTLQFLRESITPGAAASD